jgi:hypothetical protein
VIVPASGKPIGIVPEIGESEFKKTWLDDIKTWPSPRPEDEGISIVKSTLEHLTKIHGQIGAEFGKEMTIRMPVKDLFKLKENLHTNIVDGSDASGYGRESGLEVMKNYSNTKTTWISTSTKPLSDPFNIR